MTRHSDVAEPAPAPSVSRTRRAWLLTFLGFFLVIGAWSVAAPYNGTPDEQAHILRAAGVVSGQVMARPEAARGGGGAFQVVPRSLVRDNCWQTYDDRHAGCAAEPGGDETPVRVGTTAGRYHPLYYALVGWPLGLSPDWTGILLARLLSAALSAALLANALTDAMRWSRHRIAAAGVLAAVTPIAAQMASAVNPSGLEISAAVSLFAAAVPLLYQPAAGRSRTLLWHVGVAALALATLRTAGPAWLAVSLAALVLPFGWSKVRHLWRWVALRWWMLAVAVCGTASVAWSIVLRTNEASERNIPRSLAPAQAARLELERWRRYADEMVAVLAWLDARIPAPGYLVWQYAVGALVIWAFVVTYRTGRWQLAALTAGGLGIPYVIQVAYVNTYGFITQGRYLLPVLVGLPILAAFLIGAYGLAPEPSRRLLRLFAVLLLPIHLVSLVFTMVRWQQGLRSNGGVQGLNPLVGPWHPPLGSVTPLLVAVAGLALLGWLVWRDPSVAPEESAAHEPAATGQETELTSASGRGDPVLAALPRQSSRGAGTVPAGAGSNAAGVAPPTSRATTAVARTASSGKTIE